MSTPRSAARSSAKGSKPPPSPLMKEGVAKIKQGRKASHEEMLNNKL